MKIHSLKAILLGSFTALILLAFIVTLLKFGADSLNHYGYSNLVSYYVLLIVILSYGAFVVSGYLSGKIAQYNKTIHGLASGLFFSIIYFILYNLVFIKKYHILVVSILLLSPIPFFLLGAYIVVRQNRKADLLSSKILQDEKLEEFGKPQED